MRVEAGRLRRALRHYYANARAAMTRSSSTCRSAIYTPVFRRNQRDAARGRCASRPGYGAELADAIREHRALLLLIVVVAAVVALSVDVLEMLFENGLADAPASGARRRRSCSPRHQRRGH